MPDRSDTDLSSAIAALRESEARYRTALAAGRMGSWETDLVAGTRTWSPEGMALFGLALADGRGQVGGDDDEYQAALHPEDRHLVQRFHALADQQDSFPGRVPDRSPRRHRAPARGPRPGRRARPDGRAHRLVSIMADVSEQQAGRERAALERERLELALEAGQMGVYDLDIVADVLWWSRADLRRVRRRPRALRADARERRRPDPPRRPRRVHAARAAGDRQPRPLAHEFRIVRGDGAGRAGSAPRPDRVRRRRPGRAHLRHRHGHHRAQARRGGAARRRSQEGRLHRHARARAAQPARADQQRGPACCASKDADRCPGRVVPRRDRAPGGADVAPARRPARRLAHGTRPARSCAASACAGDA